MVEIVFDKQFRKNYTARVFPSLRLSDRFTQRLKVFSINPNNPILDDHPLHGHLENCRAFSITKDIRVIYQIIGDNTVRFITIGTHNQVYGK